MPNPRKNLGQWDGPLTLEEEARHFAAECNRQLGHAPALVTWPILQKAIQTLPGTATRLADMPHPALGTLTPWQLQHNAEITYLFVWTKPAPPGHPAPSVVEVLDTTTAPAPVLAQFIKPNRPGAKGKPRAQQRQKRQKPRRSDHPLPL